MWTAIATCLQRLDRIEEAILCYQKAEPHSKDGTPTLRLAILFKNQGEESKAAYYYKKFLSDHDERHVCFLKPKISQFRLNLKSASKHLYFWDIIIKISVYWMKLKPMRIDYWILNSYSPSPITFLFFREKRMQRPYYKLCITPLG